MPAKVDLRLTLDLREAVRKRAMQHGVTDGAYIRGLLCDALAIDSDLDRASKFKVSGEEVRALCGLMANVAAVVENARALQDGQAVGAIAALEAAQGRLVRMIQKAGG